MAFLFMAMGRIFTVTFLLIIWGFPTCMQCVWILFTLTPPRFTDPFPLPFPTSCPLFIFYFCNIVIVTYMHIGVRLSPGMWSTFLGPYPQWKLTFFPHKAINANSASHKGGSLCVPPSFIDFPPSFLGLIHFFPMLASGLLLLIYIPGPHCSFKFFPT